MGVASSGDACPNPLKFCASFYILIYQLFTDFARRLQSGGVGVC
jgi:hypothetical protein